MRVLVITLANYVGVYLSVTNPALDICAFVTDAPEPTKVLVSKFGRANVPVMPYYRLKDCLEDFYFDKVIDATDGLMHGKVMEELSRFSVPNDKILTLINLNAPICVDTITKLLIHYKQHITRYKMFVTGVSHTYHAIDISKFQLPTISFAYDSQDLYFDYKIAQQIIAMGGGYLLCIDRTRTVQFQI
ncbi:MAG: hypothetical protein IJ668_09095 [Selenomonadaceae bacterium]|nr:hypothetical protein [Selenomonadaceae bacterium]